MTKGIQKTVLIVSAILFLFSTAYAENAFERELVVKDQTRKTKVESVFKKLIQAYEDESASDFLDLVSDDRFRQDYITFTDALYSDIRKYDIHQVEYWIEKVVSDHVKQFLYVKWEKRFENIDDGRQGNQKGYSRFLFDEVNGKYLLVELAGNTLFGGSLKEWRDETPPIAGAIKVVVKTPVATECGPETLDACDEFNCAQNAGYWYNNQCNSQPQSVTPPEPVCDADNLNLCEESNCSGASGYWYNNTCNQSSEENNCSGYWFDGQCYDSQEAACTANGKFWSSGTCYDSEEAACTANGGYWYDGMCNTSPPLTCDQYNLNLCDETNCSSAGGGFWEMGVNKCYPTEEQACTDNDGYWYDNRCNEVPEPCAPDNLDACTTETDCTNIIDGFWDNGKCYMTAREACDARDGYFTQSTHECYLSKAEGCAVDGGTWDAVNNKCTGLPQQSCLKYIETVPASLAGEQFQIIMFNNKQLTMNNAYSVC